MATLKVKKPTSADVDHFLDVALREWQLIPELDSCDPLFVESFLTDWPVVEDRLARLDRWEQEGLMTPIQSEKLSKIHRLEAKYRTLVESKL